MMVAETLDKALQETGVIDAAMVQTARAQAVSQQRAVLEVLEELFNQSPKFFVAALADAFHFKAISMRKMHQLTPAFDIVPFAKMQQKQCLAFLDDNEQLLLVMADPFNASLQEWAVEYIKQDFDWRLAHSTDVSAYLAKHEESLSAMESFSGDGESVDGQNTDESIIHLSLKTINKDPNPVVKLVNSTLYDALKSGTSDIHLECTNQGLAIKYRIDGVIANVSNVKGLDNAEQAISRIKVMSQLDISERRIPQDGRFKVISQGREVDFRVSIMPSIYGEDAVLRVLDRKSITEESNGLTLKALGFNPTIISQFRQLAADPYGMVLVTGPTGSGKTTSLYAAISEVNTGHDKIITIEDPVEYQLPGVLQIPVNEKKGLTFARGLRSILRHDPDKIMVGEIRDPDTAQIAVQAALTGHLVFTTVHANNVLDVIGRFMHMGVDPYNFVSSVNGILAQRLVRGICPHCAEDTTYDAHTLQQSGIPLALAKAMKFKTAKGCGHCRGTGYRGRIAVAELLVLNDELREMIIAREPIRKLKEAAKRSGMRSVRDSALQLVALGKTTLEEINRVTFVG